MRLIDADALKEVKFIPSGELNPSEVVVYHMGWNDAVDAIMENAPTITDKEIVAEFLKQGVFKIHIPEPEPFTEPVKTGKWLYDGFDGYNMLGEEFRWKKCSLCGYSYSTTLSKSHNYCPNCGARMEPQ